MENYSEFLNSQKKIFSGKVFREVDIQYFESDPEKFFLNFLESPRTFESQYRFAGKNHNSGFYFASSKEVLKVEKGFDDGNSKNNKSNFFKELFRLEKVEKGKVLLEVDIEIDNIMNLTNPENIHRILTEGYSKIKSSRLCASDYLMFSIASNKGGNWFTDNIGLELYRNGYNGIIFPSVRAFNANLIGDSLTNFSNEFREMSFTTSNGIITDKFYSGLIDIEPQDILGFRSDILKAMPIYFNLLIFSGSKTLSTINNVTYTIGRKRKKFKNLFFEKSNIEIEQARILERNRIEIDIHEAFKRGLIEDYLIDAHLTGEIIFINNPDKES